MPSPPSAWRSSSTPFIDRSRDSYMSKVVLGILTGILIFIAAGILATYWVGKMRRDMEQKRPRLAHLATHPWSINKTYLLYRTTGAVRCFAYSPRLRCPASGNRDRGRAEPGRGLSCSGTNF